MISLGLLLLAALPAPEVTPLEGGGALIVDARPGPDWSEVRLTFALEPEPAGRRGLGAALAALWQRRLATDARLTHPVTVARRPHGLIVGFGAPSGSVARVLDAVLAILSEPAAPDPTARAAASAATLARRDLRDDDARLVDAEIRRRLLGLAPPEGELEDLAQLTPSALDAVSARALRRGRATLIVSGRPPDTPLAAALDRLPITGTVAAARPGRPPPPSADLHVVVIDKPARRRARVVLAWRRDAIRSEAGPTALAAALARRPGAGARVRGRWRAPLLRLSTTATVGAEAEALAGLLARTRGLRADGLDPAGWRDAVRTSTRALAMSMRDAVAAADALAEDRLAPGRSLAPVLAARLAEARSRPDGLIPTLLSDGGRVAVILTEVGRGLPRRLTELEGVGRVTIVTWDDR